MGKDRRTTAVSRVGQTTVAPRRAPCHDRLSAIHDAAPLTRSFDRPDPAVDQYADQLPRDPGTEGPVDEPDDRDDDEGHRVVSDRVHNRGHRDIRVSRPLHRGRSDVALGNLCPPGELGNDRKSLTDWHGLKQAGEQKMDTVSTNKGGRARHRLFEFLGLRVTLASGRELRTERVKIRKQVIDLLERPLFRVQSAVSQFFNFALLKSRELDHKTFFGFETVRFSVVNSHFLLRS